VATLATETWTGTTGAAWPAQWTVDGGAATIQSNTGQLAISSGTTAEAILLGVSTATFEITGSVKFVSGSSPWALIGVGQEWGDAFTQNGYTLSLAQGDGVYLRYTDASAAATDVGYAAMSLVSGGTYSFRFRRFGGVLYGRVWTGTEPGTWTVQWTDTQNKAAGHPQLSTFSAAGSSTLQWDTLTVLDGPATGVVGPVANAAGAAPAGSLSLGRTVAGPVATAAATAPAGSVARGTSATGPVATAAATAPVGAVAAAGVIAGPKASATATAPAGSLVKGQTLAGPKGSVAATAPAGVASVRVLGALATVQAQALIGTAGAIVPPTHTPDTATLLGDGTSLVTLASDGTSTSTLANALGTATLAAAAGTATVQ
jgi:hypothetical protein